MAAQQDVRAALDIMALEIGMASYNPFCASGIWKNPSGDCTNASTNQQYKGIQSAGPKGITVEMDIAGGGGDGSQEDGIISAPNEIIEYAYDDSSQTITRKVNCGTAIPFLGGGTGAVAGTKTVNLINTDAGTKNCNGDPAIFRYYDSKGNELSPDKYATDFPKIRRIDIALAVQTEQQDPSTGKYREMIYSTSVLVRNHALN